MADNKKKISQLPESTVYNPNAVLPIVENGDNKKIKASLLQGARGLSFTIAPKGMISLLYETSLIFHGGKEMYQQEDFIVTPEDIMDINSEIKAKKGQVLKITSYDEDLNVFNLMTTDMMAFGEDGANGADGLTTTVVNNLELGSNSGDEYEYVITPNVYKSGDILITSVDITAGSGTIFKTGSVFKITGSSTILDMKMNISGTNGKDGRSIIVMSETELQQFTLLRFDGAGDWAYTWTGDPNLFKDGDYLLFSTYVKATEDSSQIFKGKMFEVTSTEYSVMYDIDTSIDDGLSTVVYPLNTNIVSFSGGKVTFPYYDQYPIKTGDTVIISNSSMADGFKVNTGDCFQVYSVDTVAKTWRGTVTYANLSGSYRIANKEVNFMTTGDTQISGLVEIELEANKYTILAPKIDVSKPLTSPSIVINFKVNDQNQADGAILEEYSAEIYLPLITGSSFNDYLIQGTVIDADNNTKTMVLADNPFGEMVGSSVSGVHGDTLLYVTIANRTMYLTRSLGRPGY